MDLSIIGAGSWGTALGKLLAKNFNHVYIWSRNEEIVSSINKEHINRKYFPEVVLPENLIASLDIKYVFQKGDIVIISIPTQFIRDILTYIDQKIILKPIVSASKGIEVSSLKLISQIIEESLNVEEKYIFSLSGPSFAREVIQGLPTAVVLGGDICEGRKIQKVLSTKTFRVYTNPDLKGVEIGGAVKNVIAIATGISDGLGLGNNARASIITRGLYEMKKVAVIYGGKAETLYGLSGLGDLVLTATGNLSRNRTFGFLIGKGFSVEKAVKEIGQTVEGMETVKAIKLLQEKYGLELPISSAVYDVLYKGRKPIEAVQDLMRRELKEEL